MSKFKVKCNNFEIAVMLPLRNHVEISIAFLSTSFGISLKNTPKVSALTFQMFSRALAREPSVLKNDSNITTKDVDYSWLMESRANEHYIQYLGDSNATIKTANDKTRSSAPRISQNQTRILRSVLQIRLQYTEKLVRATLKREQGEKGHLIF